MIAIMRLWFGFSGRRNWCILIWASWEVKRDAPVCPIYRFGITRRLTFQRYMSGQSTNTQHMRKSQSWLRNMGASARRWGAQRMRQERKGCHAVSKRHSTDWPAHSKADLLSEKHCEVCSWSDLQSNLCVQLRIGLALQEVKLFKLSACTSKLKGLHWWRAQRSCIK